MENWENGKTGVEVSVRVDNQVLQDLLTNALEGGSNYWYCNADYEVPEENRGLVEEASRGIFRGYWAPFFGGALKLQVKFHGDKLPYRTSSVTYEDRVAGPGIEWRIEYEDMEIAAQIMAEKYPRHLRDAILENHDADTGDVFLQLCCFGEIIYG